MTGCQSVLDILLFVPFCRRPTLSGHRLIWDLAEAIMTMWDGYVLDYHMNGQLMAYVSERMNIVYKAYMLE